MVRVKEIILNLLPASTFFFIYPVTICYGVFPFYFKEQFHSSVQVDNVAVGKQSNSKTKRTEEPTLENRPMKLPLVGSKRSKLCNDAV